MINHPFGKLTPFEQRRLGTAAALILWCALLLVARIGYSGTRTYAFLLWNLFLAGIPMAASLWLRRLDPTRRPVLRGSLFLVWLLFLPNAPYIVTDLLHLSHMRPVPLWFDVALLLSTGATGVLLGYLSVLDVHRVLEARFGWVRGWMAMIAALGMSGYGIYLGRFVRFNSWQVVTGPGALLRTILSHLLDPRGHPAAFGVTAIYGSGLVLGYVALRVLIRNEASSVGGS
jgi:uncharacterized membrane protein